MKIKLIVLSLLVLAITGMVFFLLRQEKTTSTPYAEEDHLMIGEKIKDLYGKELNEETIEKIYLEIGGLEKNYETNLSVVSIEIEDFGKFFRILFYYDEVDFVPMYGIDIDKEKWEIISGDILG